MNLAAIQADLRAAGHRVQHMRSVGKPPRAVPVMQEGCTDEQRKAAQAAADAWRPDAEPGREVMRREAAAKLMRDPDLFAAVVSSLGRLLAADISDEADLIRRAADRLSHTGARIAREE